MTAIRDNHMGFEALQIVGALARVASIPLPPGEIVYIDFEGLGLPADARLLEFGFTGMAVLPFELVMHRLDRHRIPRRVAVYGVPPEQSTELAAATEVKGEDESNTEKQEEGPNTETAAPLSPGVNVLFSYAPQAASADAVAWDNLVTAYKAYTAENYTDIIIPANVAVESRLGRLLTNMLAGAAGREKIKNFLQDAATYSHQINVLLPALLMRTNIPRMPDHLQGLLNRLRGMRNDLAHKGHTLGLDRAAAADVVCAALFAFRYLEMVEAEVNALGD